MQGSPKPSPPTANSWHNKPSEIINTSSYPRSEDLLQRALQRIPLGTQTFSKSQIQFPMGVSPLFVARADGCHVWDVDGNEYVDFVSALLAVSLGYGDPDVVAAVEAQMKDGTLFSLPHPIEIEVAEKLCEMVPCADMVRFGKNGSDATAGAVRLARAHTGRDRVAVCGYHGWQDWFIGSTSRDLGVPQVVRDLTHDFLYNDLDSLHALFADRPGEFAAVILEPMNAIEPAPGFLEGVRAMATTEGTVLIFDEMITGFRFANGGAQELFGVTPDLATFGKGMANGYAVSAVAGRGDIMRLMEEVFFSFTMGGETLSLAAAGAVLTKLQHEPVVERLSDQGRKVVDGTRRLIQSHGIDHMLSVSGHPCWSFLTFAAALPYTKWQIYTLFLQEIFARGVLCLSTHNMSYAHGNEDIAVLLNVYDEVFPLLRDAVINQDLDSRLRCSPLQPLFRVR